MELQLVRKTLGPVATLGDLSIDGAYECHILEDKVREIPGQPVASWKVWGKTAIPAGRYKIEVVHSPHFGRLMPHLIDVPGYTGVLIHWGNTDVDTDGCLITGTTIDGPDHVSASRLAWESLFPKIEDALAASEEVWIAIT